MDDVQALWDAQCEAMDAGDTAALRECFTPDATLTHMTGYVQPLEEWLAAMRRRELVYHRLEQRDVQVRVDGERAHLVGRITTGITDDGSGHAWPLRCDQDYVLTADGWRCTASRVTLDR